MKIDRLLGIVMILLQKDRVSAPYLAEKFEVSRRTINRDIETLCMAGIPIVTMQGGKGGISIAEGYKVDKSVLTYEELSSVVAAIRGLDSVSYSPYTDKLLRKFFIKPEQVISPKDSIIINLSSHYKSALTEKFGLIKAAISNNKRISFRYYSDKGDSVREIEPYYLAFQWSAWYVFGYCIEREDFRLFKLNRLWELKEMDISFKPREIPEERKEFDGYFSDEIQISVIFDESVKYRLVEEYGVECYQVTPEGKLQFQTSFTNKEYMISWILSFGDKAEVIYPTALKKELKQIAMNIYQRYQGT